MAAAAVMAAAAAAYCRGRLLFIVKIFLCGIFMMCGGNWSVPKIEFVFVLHKHKFVICVCESQTCVPKI